MPQSGERPDLILHEPTENAEIPVGVDFHVRGVAVGVGLPEPDIASSVTIQVGAQPEISARLTPPTPNPHYSFIFDEVVRLTDVGMARVTVTADFTNKDISQTILVGTPNQTWCHKAPWTNYTKTEAISDENPAPYSTCQPQTLVGLVAVIREAEAAGRHVHAFGSRWASSDCARSSDVVVDTTKLKHKLQTVQRALRSMSQPLVYHVESGIQIAALNRLLDQDGLALETMGGASGQTLAGAVSTGTHGGDKDMAPLADSVLAIHLVGAGGTQFWIEPSAGVTDALSLRQYVVPGVNPENVIYDDRTFDACLVSLGCMGIIYAVVLRVRGRYDLEETIVASTWGTIKQEIHQLLNDPTNRFLQIALNPYGKNDTNLCLVTTRKEASYTVPVNRGDQIARVRSAVQEMVVAANPSVAVSELVHGFCSEDTLSGEEKFAQVINSLLTSPFPFTTDWNLMAFYYGKLLLAAYPIRSIRGASYSVMDLGYGYPSRVSQPGWSIELSFPALDNNGRLGCTNFIDAAISEIWARNSTYFAGYMSLRFTGPTRAMLGMQQWNKTCAVEIAFVQGVEGLLSLLTKLYNLGLDHGGLPHWGQLLDLARGGDDATKYRRYDEWIQMYGRLSKNFRSRTFSNKLSDRWKLTIPAANARFLSQNVPDELRPGESAVIWITLENTGAATWDPAMGFNLGSQSPRDNETWGLHRLPLPSKVPPGTRVVLEGRITAPSTPGLYIFQWQMVQDVVQWFGELTLEKQIAIAVKTTTVPPLIESRSQDAERQVLAANLAAKFTGETRRPAYVIAQDPDDGRTVEVGPTVTMNLRYGNPP